MYSLQYPKVSHTRLATQRLDFDSPGLVASGSVQVRPGNPAMVCPCATKSATQSSIGGVAARDGQCFSHDGAPTRKNLQVGHLAATNRRIVGDRSGQGSQSCWAGLAEEGTDTLGLDEESLHC